MTDRTIKVVVDPTGAETGSARVRRAMSGISDEARKTQGGLAGLRTSFQDMMRDFQQGAVNGIPVIGRAIASIGPVALGAAAGLAVFTTAVMKGAALSEEFSKTQRRLEVTLAGAAGQLRLTKNEAVAMAFELESSLAISKETIIDAQASLATFSGITRDNFERVIRTAADMSSVFKGDLKQNVEVLGMALQNLSEGNVEGLSRGLRFLGVETLDTIKAMAEMGDTAGATDALLAAIEKRIGGAAEADASGLTGSIFRLKDAWGELHRELAEGTGGVSIYQGAIDALTYVVGGLREMVAGTSRELAVLKEMFASGEGFIGMREAITRVDQRLADQRASTIRPDWQGLANAREGEARKAAREAELAAAREAEAAAARERAAAAAERATRAIDAQARAAQLLLDRERSVLGAYEERAAIAGELLAGGETAAELLRVQLALGRQLSQQERERVVDAMKLAAVYQQAADTMRDLSRAMGEVRRGNMGSPLRPVPEERDDELGRITARIARRREGEKIGESIGRGFNSEALQGAEALGNIIGGKVGQSISRVTAVIGTLQSGSFKGMTDRLLGKLGANEKAMKALGAAGEGAQLGAMIGSFSGSKAGKIGGSAGGAIGSAFGPIGSLIGSIAGTIFGSIFAGSRKASVALGTGSGGLLLDNAAKGNSARLRDAAEGMAGGFGRTLQSIATALGGSLLADAQLGSIGARGKKFTFDPSGRGRTKGSGVLTFRDEESAIQAAVRNALRVGVITGVSDFSKRLLATAKDIDQAVSIAARWENVLRELDEAVDPVGAAIRAATRDLDALGREMRQVGATTEELGKLEEVRQLRLKRSMDEQLSSLRDFQGALFGEGSGLTALSRLSRATDDYNAQRALIGGAGFNQQAFSAAGQSVLALAREVFGTATPEFQAIRERLIADTAAAVTGVERRFEDTRMAEAMNDQTRVAAQSYQQLVIANTYLERIAAAIGTGGAIDVTVNGYLANVR